MVEGEHEADPVNAGRTGGDRLAEAKAKRMGLQGDERCPGATKHGQREKCEVYKNELGGKGRDDKQGH